VLESPEPHDPALASVLREQIKSLLTKEAFVVMDPQTSPGFYSHYFLASKKDFRPLLNLRGLNRHIRCDKFPMEALQNILSLVSPGDWMYSLDLKDAYLHVPVHLFFCKYLRFAFRNPQGILIVFKWTVLPFGLATATRVFTKVVAPVMARLHVSGHLVFPYIDDMFGLACHRTSAIIVGDACLLRFLDLGFIIILNEWTPESTQDLTRLGGRILTRMGIVCLMDARATTVADAA
jgi:hypothetical protein